MTVESVWGILVQLELDEDRCEIKIDIVRSSEQYRLHMATLKAYFITILKCDAT